MAGGREKKKRKKRGPLFRWVFRRMREQSTDKEEVVEKETERFLKKTGWMLAAGLILILCTVLAQTLFERTYQGLSLTRNPFGEGERKENVILKQGEREESFTLSLEEQEISEAELNRTFRLFFETLKEEMKGENSSFEEVCHNLNFPESIDGYPFSITYETSDADLVLLDGSLGEAASKIRDGEEKEATIHIEAAYKDYERDWTVKVRLIAPEEEKVTLMDRVKEELTTLEQQSRQDEEVKLPETVLGVSVTEEGKGQKGRFLVILFIFVTIFLPVHRILGLKEKSDKLQAQAGEDFPTIVYLLCLYLESGSTFPGAVRRIGRDYRKRRDKDPRFAFEKVLQMEQKLDSGVSQREACRFFGRQFRAPGYQKLSMLLIQSFSKGARESRLMLDRMEEEAFRERIDHARKKGEEASTKLLFPMIILLCEVMVLVMFPAVLRFQSF